MLKEWAYVAKLNGETYSSSLQAHDRDAALKQLERMNFKDIKISDVEETRNSIKIARLTEPTPRPEQITEKVSDTIEGLAQHVRNIATETEERHPATRMESILFGDKSVLVTAGEYLEHNGTVKHAIVRPDHTGKMSFFLVIEHDIGGQNG